MITPVWLLADHASGMVSYLRHGRVGDEANWRRVGPFSFTTEEAATQAARDPKFLPEGVTARFRVLEVDAVGFIQAVYNGFPPEHTDVFILDNTFLPLTAEGAAWIDDATGSPIWAALFDEDGDGVGLDWLDHVLEVVATRLGVSMETVQAIGSLNAADEDAASVEQTRSLIQQHVRLTLTPEPGTVELGLAGPGVHRLTGSAQFWLHTTGMTKFGLPELEIRNIPVWWVAAAGEELIHWAAYSLEHGIVEDVPLQGGTVIPLDIRVRLSPDPAWIGHSTGCLRLEVLGATYVAEKKTERGPGPPPPLVH
jgi:hypothetical protein